MPAAGPTADFFLPCRRTGGEKWVHHPDSVVVLSVIQIFAIDGVAAHALRGGENRRVPVRNGEALFCLDGFLNQVQRYRPNGKRCKRFEHRDSFFMRHL
jgi:hypothetical protein